LSEIRNFSEKTDGLVSHGHLELLDAQKQINALAEDLENALIACTSIGSPEGAKAGDPGSTAFQLLVLSGLGEGRQRNT